MMFDVLLATLLSGYFPVILLDLAVCVKVFDGFIQ